MHPLDQRYMEIVSGKTDISEHMWLLRSMGALYPHITEMGVRYGNSTIGFLVGRPKVLRSYDITRQIDVQRFKCLASLTDFEFIEGDSLKVEIENTDVLFLDTLHQAPQVAGELTRHSKKVRRFILLHDTETFGQVGDNGGPGIMFAVSAFLEGYGDSDGRDWRLHDHFKYNNGMTVLSRKSVVPSPR